MIDELAEIGVAGGKLRILVFFLGLVQRDIDRFLLGDLFGKLALKHRGRECEQGRFSGR